VASQLPGDDRVLSAHIAGPARIAGDRQHAVDLSVAFDAAAEHERPGVHDVADEAAVLADNGRRRIEAVQQASARRIGHELTSEALLQ